jgi:hypothetical protein
MPEGSKGDAFSTKSFGLRRMPETNRRTAPSTKQLMDELVVETT